MDAFKLNERVLAATAEAEARIRKAFEESDTRGRLVSYEGGEGVWETAEGIGILRWERDDLPLLRDATNWLCKQQHGEGGYAPMPDVPSTRPYVEPTARVTMSLAGTFRALGGNERRRVTPRLQRLARWLIDQQDPQAGGWGSRLGFDLRIAPTTGAIQALRAFGQAQPRSALAEPAIEAAERGVAWILRSPNRDGGYGVRPGVESNVGSSGQAAWALSAMGAPVPPELQDYIQARVEHHARDVSGALRDVIDHVGDPAERGIDAPFALNCLGQPWALIGLLSAHGNVHADATLSLVESMLRGAKDGVWRYRKRYVWPTYFHVVALRQWSWVYAAHSQAATVDITALLEEARPAQADQPISLVRELRLPDAHSPLADLVAKVLAMTDLQQHVLVGMATWRTRQEVGRPFNLSDRTIEGYNAVVKDVLGTDDRLELHRIAVAAGLVECPSPPALPQSGQST